MSKKLANFNRIIWFAFFFSRVTEPLLWRTVKITAPLQMFFLYFTGVGGNKTLRRKESKIVSERFWNKKCSSYETLTKQATFFTTENNTAIISLVDSLPSTQQLKSKQKIFYDICPHSRPHSEPNDRIFVR